MNDVTEAESLEIRSFLLTLTEDQRDRLGRLALSLTEDQRDRLGRILLRESAPASADPTGGK